MHPSRPEKTFAPPEARPRYARERTYDIAHIRLELELDERSRSLRGSLERSNVTTSRPSRTSSCTTHAPMQP